MSDGMEVAPVMEGQSVITDPGYKLTRIRLAEALEAYTGDKGKALDLLERWERGTWACALLAAPSASEAREAFGMAATAFLGD